MRIIIREGAQHPDLAPFDVAERKGIGHPDSLADLIADTFSRDYLRYCVERVGVVPNHWVDKVTLVGAAAHVEYGDFRIDKPVDCFLFGKVTAALGAETIPVDRLFAGALETVLPDALRDDEILPHLRMHVNNTAGVATDHDPEFYQPVSGGGLNRVMRAESVSNDTVLCAAAGARGLAAQFAIWLESLVNGTVFRERHPGIGTDVKVLVVREGGRLDVTAAVPVHPRAVRNWEEYRACVEEVRLDLAARAKRKIDEVGSPVDSVRLHLNTKDTPGRGYLAPFGTSLGKGDCGAVGRGNRYQGAIEPLRPAGGEAPAGKNPLHHAGKIYTSLAHSVADRLATEEECYAEVTIVARNGAPLDEPAYVLVSTDGPPRPAIEALVRAELSTVARFVEDFRSGDPLDRFRLT